jgi:hypothetical protein
MTACLECSAPFTAYAKGRVPQRFCSPACKRKFNHRRESRGAMLYDLWRVFRRERALAVELGIQNEMNRLDLSWHDEDAGKRTWKPARMALDDIAALDRPPTTNLYVRK